MRAAGGPLKAVFAHADVVPPFSPGPFVPPPQCTCAEAYLPRAAHCYSPA